MRAGASKRRIHPFSPFPLFSISLEYLDGTEPYLQYQTERTEVQILNGMKNIFEILFSVQS